MIRINFFLVIGILFIQSCKSQNIKISVAGNKSDSLKVFRVSSRDTIPLKTINTNYYTIKGKEKEYIIIEYKNIKYKLKNIDGETKSIIIYYNSNADKGCYVVNRIRGDTTQTYYSDYIQLNGLNHCKSITNINIYCDYKISKSIIIRRIN